MVEKHLMLPFYPENQKEYRKIYLKSEIIRKKRGLIISYSHPRNSAGPVTPSLFQKVMGINHFLKLVNYTCQMHWQRKRRIATLLMISPTLACVKCGCNIITRLEINHKNGKGYQEMKTRKGDLSYNIISQKRSTDDLEILCRSDNALHFHKLKDGITLQQIVWKWDYHPQPLLSKMADIIPNYIAE